VLHHTKRGMGGYLVFQTEAARQPGEAPGPRKFVGTHVACSSHGEWSFPVHSGGSSCHTVAEDCPELRACIRRSLQKSGWHVLKRGRPADKSVQLNIRVVSLLNALNAISTMRDPDGSPGPGLLAVVEQTLNLL
jgi:hypothetical protein